MPVREDEERAGEEISGESEPVVSANAQVDTKVALMASEAARAVAESALECAQSRIDLQSGIGHDLKNMLTAPLILVDFMLEALGEPETVNIGQLRQDLAAVRLSLLRVVDLTHRVMDADGNLRINREEVELPVLIDAVVKYCRSFLGDKIRINFEQVDALIVDADRSNLFSVLLNLIKNAGEALAERVKDGSDSIIDVRFSVMKFGHHQVTEFLNSGKHVMIEVEDNGPGVPKKIREDIFAKGVTTKGDKGHGIGLPMVRKIVRAHGGDILLDAVTDEDIALDDKLRGRSSGSKFTIILPVEKKKR